MAITKVCTKCKETKSLSEFYKNKRGLHGCRSDCRNCHNKDSVARVAQWRLNHPDQRNANDRRYRERNREKCREAIRKSYKKYYGKYVQRIYQWRTENPDKVKAIYQRYKKNNRAKVYAWNNNRRARLASIEGNLTPNEWQTILEMYEHRCVYCYQELDHPTQEHIVPIVEGGRHDESNVVPACKSCNSKKGSRSLLRYLYKERLNWQLPMAIQL